MIVWGQGDSTNDNKIIKESAAAAVISYAGSIRVRQLHEGYYVPGATGPGVNSILPNFQLRTLICHPIRRIQRGVR